jgi:protein involved in polysaccharide export with SLBB domain
MISYPVDLAIRARPFFSTLSLLIFLAFPSKLAAHQEASTKTLEAAATATTPPGGSPAQSDRPALQHRDDRYRLCASDVVAFTFPLTPEFDQTVNIQPDGFASLAGVGDVHLEGLTTAQSVEAVRTAYTKVLHNPIVTVELKTFNKPYFVVNGQVHQPGRYDLRGYTTATQAIAIAGGFEESSKHSQVLLFRRVNDNWYEVKNLNLKHILQGRDVNEDVEIRAGDMLMVPQNFISKIKKFIPSTGVGTYYQLYR